MVGVVLDFGFDNMRLFGPVESLNLATRRDEGQGGPALPFAAAE